MMCSLSTTNILFMKEWSNSPVSSNFPSSYSFSLALMTSNLDLKEPSFISRSWILSNSLLMELSS